jgi:hypothetical protein
VSPFTSKAHPAEAGVAKPRVLALLRDAALRVSYRRPQESTTVVCLHGRRGSPVSILTKGEYMGLAPTGKQVTFRGIQMQRISNGRIEEEWAGFNTLGAFQEIGALPPLGQPAVAAR